MVASHRGFLESAAAEDQAVPGLIDAAADERDLAAGCESGRGRLLELRACDLTWVGGAEETASEARVHWLAAEDAGGGPTRRAASSTKVNDLAWARSKELGRVLCILLNWQQEVHMLRGQPQGNGLGTPALLEGKNAKPGIPRHHDDAYIVKPGQGFDLKIAGISTFTCSKLEISFERSGVVTRMFLPKFFMAWPLPVKLRQVLREVLLDMLVCPGPQVTMTVGFARQPLQALGHRMVEATAVFRSLVNANLGRELSMAHCPHGCRLLRLARLLARLGLGGFDRSHLQSWRLWLNQGNRLISQPCLLVVRGLHWSNRGPHRDLVHVAILLKLHLERDDVPVAEFVLSSEAVKLLAARPPMVDERDIIKGLRQDLGDFRRAPISRHMR